MYYTSATLETAILLLKTAIAEVTFDKNQAEANILFDEGVQGSLISEKASKQT